MGRKRALSTDENRSQRSTRVSKKRESPNQVPATYVGYQNEQDYLLRLLNATLDGKESNSIIITGPRGSGKTCLVKNCFEKIPDLTSRAILLHLDGFLNRDDESVIGRLMSLVDTDAPSIHQVFIQVKKYIEDNEKTLIIILDEFDRFCRKNQIVIYNLFNLTHTTKKVFVIGITRRFDCLELLEKRVYSRTNKGLIQLSSPFASFDDYLNHAKTLLKGRAITKEENVFLKNLYSENRTPRSLELAILEWKCTKPVPTTLQPKSDDPVVRRIVELSHQKLLIVSAAHSFCRNHKVNTFHAKSLFAQISRIPNRMEVPKELQHTLICDLIQAGLLNRIIPSTRQQSNLEFLNDSTMLQLGFNSVQLREAITLAKANIPSYLRGVLDGCKF